MPSAGAKATESPDVAGVGAAPAGRGEEHAASIMPATVRAMETRTACATTMLLRRASGIRSLAADHRIPRQLDAIAATLGDDLHSFGRDRDRIDLSFVLQLSLDALVEFRRHLK